MPKEIKINGYIEAPEELTIDEFAKLFTKFIEANRLHFDGGFHEIIDDHKTNDNTEKICNIINSRIK